MSATVQDDEIIDPHLLHHYAQHLQHHHDHLHHQHHLHLHHLHQHQNGVDGLSECNLHDSLDMICPNGHSGSVCSSPDKIIVELSNSKPDNLDAISTTSSRKSTKSTKSVKKEKVPKYMKSAPIKLLTHPVDRNFAWSFLGSVIFVAVSLVTGLPLILLLVGLLPVAYACRLTCKACHACQEGVFCEEPHEQQRFTAPTDTFWLYDSEFNHHIAHALLFMEPGVTASSIANHIVDRVLDRTNEEGKHIFRRLMRKIVPAVAGFYWIDDEHFNIDNHVVDDQKFVKDATQLTAYVTALMSRGMSADKPLWDIRVLTNYNWGHETVLVVRVHHAITDGMSLVKLLCNHLADNAQTQYVRFKPRFGGASYPLNVFRALVVGPMTFVMWLLRRRQECNYFQRGRKVIRGERSIAWSREFRASTLYRIKQITRSSLNDVLMAATAGALRTFMKRKGIQNPPDVKVCIPIDLRYEPTNTESTAEFGTQFSTATIRLPSNTEGSIPRLWDVRQEMEELKSSADAVVMYGAMQFIWWLLPYRSAHWFKRVLDRRSTLFVNNLPGPDDAVTLDSRKIRNIVAWSGWTPEVPIHVTYLTYAGALHMTVSAERALLPEPDELIRLFAKELRHLTSLLSGRRIPGEHRRRTSICSAARKEEIIKPSVQEIHARLQKVQDELHEVTQKLEEVAASSDASKTSKKSNPPPSSPTIALKQRLEELKEEFQELLLELQRRKSIADGVTISIEEEDLGDSQLRHPRRRALSVTVRRSSLTALVTSTTRPLTTSATSPTSPRSWGLPRLVSGGTSPKALFGGCSPKGGVSPKELSSAERSASPKEDDTRPAEIESTTTQKLPQVLPSPLREPSPLETDIPLGSPHRSASLTFAPGTSLWTPSSHNTPTFSTFRPVRNGGGVGVVHTHSASPSPPPHSNASDKQQSV